MKFFTFALSLWLFAFAFTAHGFEGLANGRSLKIFNRIDCGASMACTRGADGKFDVEVSGSFSSSVIGNGAISLYGFNQNQIRVSTSTAISVGQCGSSFINTATAVMALPEASTALGCRLTFITESETQFDVNPDDADQIFVETNAVGDAIRNSTQGNSIVLESSTSAGWSPISNVGTWTDVN